MLLAELSRNPLFYVMVVVAVMVSIVLHELAHGLAAIRQGDDTPIHSGHMTLNPLVHMGGMSIVALFVIGIAWGQMPVTPSRFRSRYGDALVAAAGPVTNLLIGAAALTACGLWLARGPEPTSAFGKNMLELLDILGRLNLVLCIFNLVPIPPLDGAAILANFNDRYRRFANDPGNQQALMFGFIIAFVAASAMFPVVNKLTFFYFGWLASLG